MPGRKKAKVTNLFKELDSTGKVGRVKCNFCSQIFAKSGSRMTQHIRNCRKCPCDIKDKYLETESTKGQHSLSQKSFPPQDNVEIGSSSASKEDNISHISKPIASTSTVTRFTTVSDSPSTFSPPITPLKKRKSDIDTFIDKISNDENNLISVALARAIFSSGTPFSIVENPSWLKVFHLMRPAYQPPSRTTLSTTLLDNELTRISTAVKEMVADCETVGLMCDGWSNIRNQPIINFIVTTPVPIFWKSLATGTDSHTGEYIAGEICKVVKDIAEKANSQVFGVVTDNAANMKKAWQIISNNYPAVVCYGCAAHSLDLIFSDINKLNNMKSLMGKVVGIVKEFKQNHLLGELLRKYQNTPAVSLKLPVKTRWGSTVQCLKSVHANKQALRKLVVDGDQEENTNIASRISSQTETNILSQPFWDAVIGFINLLDPLAKVITKVETDRPMLSSIISIFISLEEIFETFLPLSPLNQAEETQAMEILSNRKEFCIKMIHKAANLLDPRFYGNSLSQEEKMDVMEYISDLAEKMNSINHTKVVEDLAHYLAKEEIFGRKFLWEAVQSTSPTAWWMGFCKSTELSKLAAPILKLPATTAAVERSFSSYSNIHTAKRNRLTVERAGKLVFISQNLKLQNINIKNLSATETVVDEPKTTDAQEIVIDTESELEFTSASDKSDLEEN